MADTPFMRFWRTINTARVAAGRPEITYGPAKRAWRDLIGDF